MTYSYFPGCTLKNKAKDLDHYARECAKVLGFELEEIENWQCCGAVLGWNPQKTTYAELVEIMAKHDRQLAKQEKAMKAAL